MSMNENTRNHQSLSMESTQLLSSTITALRFPLIVGVVLLHVEIPCDASSYPFSAAVRYLLYNGLANLAVPLFFFISGFLFFYKTTFTFEKYIEKLKKRFHTLFIPYLFWNLAFMALVLFFQMFLPALNNRRFLSDYSFVDFINSFWNYSGLGYGCPILGPTWFLRDLILMVIASPVLYFLIRYAKACFIILLGGCYIGNFDIGLMGFPASWLFFSLGAFFSIFQLNFAAVLRKYSLIFIPTGIFFLMAIIYLHVVGYDHGMIYRTYILFGIFVVISFVSRQAPNKIDVISRLAESSFFVYVFHGFFINPLSSTYTRVVPQNGVTIIMGYFFVTAVACAFSVCVYFLLKKYTPKFCSFIVGGR